MQNPKTTLSGYLTLASTLAAALAQLLPPRASQIATTMAIAVGGASAAIGNITSKDGGH